MNYQRAYEKMLNTLIIREIQTHQTTLRYQLTPIRMDAVRKTKNNKYWLGLEKM